MMVLKRYIILSLLCFATLFFVGCAINNKDAQNDEYNEKIN